MPLVLSTMLPFFEFSDMSKAHFIMVSTTHLSLLSSFMLIQMRTGQVIQLINALSQVSVFCWVLLLSRGVARRKMWFPVLVLRLSIVPLPTPPANMSGFVSSWLTWMLHSPLPLLSIVTIIVLSTLLIMMSYKHTKHIEIDCHITWQHLKKGNLKLFSISSVDQPADIFTKTHPPSHLRDLIFKLQLASSLPPRVRRGMLVYRID